MRSKKIDILLFHLNYSALSGGLGGESIVLLSFVEPLLPYSPCKLSPEPVELSLKKSEPIRPILEFVILMIAFLPLDLK